MTHTISLSEFGSSIKKIRKDLGWKQSDLASKAGLNKQTICRLESGNPVTLETASAVLIAIGNNPGATGPLCIELYP